MEGHVIERRQSSAQLWSDSRHNIDPSTSTTSAGAVPAYSNIFVTPPDHDRRPHLERMKEVDKPDIGLISQIKDKHEGETQMRNNLQKFPIHTSIRLSSSSKNSFGTSQRSTKP